MSTASHATQQEIKKQEIFPSRVCPSHFRQCIVRKSFHKIQYFSVVGKDDDIKVHHATILIGKLERDSSSIDNSWWRYLLVCRYSDISFLSLVLFILILCFYVWSSFCIWNGMSQQRRILLLSPYSFNCVHLFLDMQRGLHVCICILILKHKEKIEMNSEKGWWEMAHIFFISIYRLSMERVGQ